MQCLTLYSAEIPEARANGDVVVWGPADVAERSIMLWCYPVESFTMGVESVELVTRGALISFGGGVVFTAVTNALVRGTYKEVASQGVYGQFVPGTDTSSVYDANATSDPLQGLSTV